MRLPVSGRAAAWILFAWLVACAGFVVLAAFAASNDRFSGDLWLTEQVQEVNSDVFGKTLDYTAEFGDLPLMVVAALLGGAIACRFADWTDGALVVGALASRGVNSAVKLVIDRPRPSPALVRVGEHESSSSFPSGHADTVVVLFGFMFYLAAVHIKDLRLRLAAQAVCVWVILVTGVQRIYVGAHWPSDVLGGYYLGALMLAGLIALHWLVRARARGLS